MRNYNWWLGRKTRVRKKYTLLLGRYYSPKEIKEWYKDFNRSKDGRIEEKDTNCTE